MMGVVGLDLSLTSTGVARADGSTFRIRTKFVGMARIDAIWNELSEHALGSDYLTVIEGYSMGTARQNSHAHALGELGGVVRYKLWKTNFTYVEVPPAVLKRYATGHGNAGKEEVLVAAVRRLGYEGASNDEADALWLRALALDFYGAPVVQMPATHREAFAKLDWPLLTLVSGMSLARDAEALSLRKATR
jgi:crossover junction endodeoxyribonuclease RuvC